jgi:prolyl-tRNA editing enzyme YbaK/EbsC (Cys-tRNA(Pro) deacylase)
VKLEVRRVQAALEALGLERRVIELERSAHTSQQAADALGVAVGSIAKSLVFTVHERPVLVIASGANRVDEDKLTILAGGPARRADADTVKRATGFVIGGVAPIAHEMPLEIFIDEDLLRLELIYAAAGVPECVFPLSPAELVRATGGRVVDVKEQRKPVIKGERP